MSRTADRPSVGVLLGGSSPEREVSLASGEAVAAALEGAGWEVSRYDYGTAAAEETAIAELVLESLQTGALCGVAAIFIGLHGGAGEDGRVQSLLELAGMPYTGSGVLASALSMDKWLSKSVLRRAGVPVPDAHLWLRGDILPPALTEGVWGAELGWPLVIKPVDQGSTVGFSLAESPDDVPAALERAGAFGPRVLVEAYIPGREVTVAVLDDQALPVVEIRPSHGVYDYECKYTAGMSSYDCPADLEPEITLRLQEAALAAFTELQHRDYARMDYRLDPKGNFYMLEANTLPGFTGTSLVPKAAAAAGIDFPDLCERIVLAALARGPAVR